MSRSSTWHPAASLLVPERILAYSNRRVFAGRYFRYLSTRFDKSKQNLWVRNRETDQFSQPRMLLLNFILDSPCFFLLFIVSAHFRKYIRIFVYIRYGPTLWHSTKSGTIADRAQLLVRRRKWFSELRNEHLLQSSLLSLSSQAEEQFELFESTPSGLSLWTMCYLPYIDWYSIESCPNSCPNGKTRADGWH